LEKLEKRLFSRNTSKTAGDERSGFGQRDEIQDFEIKEDWQKSKIGGFDELASRVSGIAGRKSGIVKKFFIFSVLFFVVAAGVAAFVLFGGVNMISSKNVDIKVIGPVSIGGGQEVSFEINIANNNNTDLESASLLVEYPDGVRSAADLTKTLDQERYDLGEVKSGENFNQNIKAVFFGEKESIKEIKISLEYRVQNSSALFYKEKNYEVTISSAPIIVTPTYSKEVNSNQEMSLNIELASNSNETLNNFLVKVEYPFGFTFKNASLDPTFGNNTWKLSNLKTGEKKNILIKGVIVGQDGEERVFKINAGTANEDDEREISVPFSQLEESVLIKKSFASIEVLMNEQDGDISVRGGDQVGVRIYVKNNLPSKLFNVSAEAYLSGGALNPSAVSVNDGGFFQSANKTIFWDKRSTPDFSEMNSGSQTSLMFSIYPLQYDQIIKGSKPEISLVVKIKGDRITESGSSEQISAMETRKITLSSDISLSVKTTRSVGNIENSGPIPPKADTPTTYTAVWSIGNSFNQISGVEVKATLPSYVKWTGLFSPASELVSYDVNSNQVVWKVGSVLPNTSQKQLYFQLEFLPSLSQVGQVPIILGESVLTGTDKVTGLKIQNSAYAITSDFYGDPTYKTGDGNVAQ